MYECPHRPISCIHLNTMTMTLDVPCDKCENYNSGVMYTGAIPDLGLKKLWNKWHLYIVIVLSLLMVISMLIFRSCVSII